MPNPPKDKPSEQPIDTGFDVKKQIKSIITLGVIFAVVYFTSQAIQIYMGKRAAQATGLPNYSLDEAVALSQQTNKLILVDVSAYWCPACRKLDKEVLSHAGVKDIISSNYIFARIDYDSEQGQDFVEKYNIRGVPSLLLLDADKNVVRWLTLSFDPQQFMSQL